MRLPVGSFDDAAAYDRFMGRYSVLLAPQLAELAGVDGAQRVLDVGCGTGALTAELVRRLRAGSVTALDRSEAFVAAVRERYPGVHAVHGAGEALPFADRTFDVTLAQLSVGHMQAPLVGLAEMIRVTRPGGVVAVCDWVPREENPLHPFWSAVGGPRHRRRGWVGRAQELRDLGLEQVEEHSLAASVRYERFDEWWTPMTEGVGPTAVYAKQLDPAARAQLRERCRESMTPEPFVLAAVARATRGRKETQ